MKAFKNLSDDCLKILAEILKEYPDQTSLANLIIAELSSRSLFHNLPTCKSGLESQAEDEMRKEMEDELIMQIELEDELGRQAEEEVSVQIELEEQMQKEMEDEMAAELGDENE